MWWLFVAQGDAILGIRRGNGDPHPALLKFGKKQDIERFAQGVLYMNTLKRFVEMESESDPLRGDSREGVSLMLQADRTALSIAVDGQFVPIGGIIGPIYYRQPDLLNVNVFCMHALREPGGASGIFVDPINFAFGDTYAIVLDFDEFMRRLAARVPTGHLLQSGLVEYVDEASYHGSAGVFKKLSSFSYQSEFRIALLPGTGAVLQLELGDLSDILILGPLPELNDRLSVQVISRPGRDVHARA
jgi:hypothetical protein